MSSDLTNFVRARAASGIFVSMPTGLNKDLQHKCETVCSTCAHRHENPICSNDHVLNDIAQIKTDLHLSAGETIFQMGDTPRGFYSVKKGLIKLENYSRSGASHTLRLFGPGSAFGYRSLFSGEPASAAAIAVEDSEVCLLPREPILALAKKNPEILLKFVEQLSSDLKMAEQKWVHQMDMGATERVAEALLFLNDSFQGIQWTRREIAQWAGTTPETVIRTLAQFEKDGLIDQTQGRNILVKNKTGLEKFIKS